jgi:hypothetical protein
MASTRPTASRLFNWCNFQYLWSEFDYPFLLERLSESQLPKRVVQLLAGQGITRVKALIERDARELRCIVGFGPKSLQQVEAMLAQHHFHLAVFDPRMVPPPGDRWLNLRPHPVLESRAPAYTVTWLSRGTSIDAIYLRDCLEAQIFWTIADLLECTAHQFLSCDWHPGGFDDYPPLSSGDSLRWVQELLAHHGLSLRPE